MLALTLQVGPILETAEWDRTERLQHYSAAQVDAHPLSTGCYFVYRLAGYAGKV